MKRNALNVINKINFNIGDKVLVKKDFDNNKNTKK